MLKVEFLRFDMSEYMEKHAVSRLIGAPPGYVGYEEGGLLIDAIRKAPHAVLLLDEIEKAHPDLFAILLQVMDHATLTDTHGRQADFRHVILIMTTNAGARDLSGRKMGFGDAGGRQPRHRRARADVLARVPQPPRRDRPLPRARRRRDRAASSTSTSTSCAALVAGAQDRPSSSRRRPAPGWRPTGFDRAFGARPMARLVERTIKKPLSELLLFGEVSDGARIIVDADGRKPDPARRRCRARSLTGCTDCLTGRQSGRASNPIRIRGPHSVR